MRVEPGGSSPGLRFGIFGKTKPAQGKPAASVETAKTKRKADEFVKGLYKSLMPDKAAKAGLPKRAPNALPHIPIDVVEDPDPGWGRETTGVLEVPYAEGFVPSSPVVKPDALLDATFTLDGPSLAPSMKSEAAADTNPFAKGLLNVSYFPQPVPGGPLVEEPNLTPQSHASSASRSKGGGSSSSASSTAGMVSGPVIDPNTGALQKPALREFIDGLVDLLPPLPKDAPSSCAKQHARLVAELRAIQSVAADGGRLKADHLGLAVRDHFAKASSLARQLSGELNPTIKWKPVGRERLNSSLTYLIVAGLLFELKRVHLSAAAKDITDAYVDKEVANLDRAAQGLLASSPWASVSWKKSGGLDVNHNGGQGGLSIRGERTIMNDDPSGGAPVHEVSPVTGEVREVGTSDVDYWDNLGIAAQGGFNWSIKGWGLSLLGKVDMARGSAFFEHSSLRDLLPLIVNLDNNRSPARSAGPRARKVMAALQNLKAKTGKAFGRDVVETPGRPAYLHDKKIAKGFTALKLDMACSMLDASRGDESFRHLISSAYPLFGDILRERLASGDDIPQRRVRLQDSAAYPDPDKRFGFEHDAIGGTFKAGKSTSNASAIWNASGNLTGRVTGDRMRFNEATKAPAHRIFNLGYFKDFATLFGLMSDLDALGSHPRLHWYRRVQQVLGGTPPEKFKLGPEQEHQYGPADSVPAPLRRAVLKPTAARLQETTAVIRDLALRYTHFVDGVNVVLSRPDRHLAKAQPQEHERLRSLAFKQIQNDVWAGSYPQGMEKALKHPERFVSESYDALSLALGAAGVHLSTLKHELARHDTEQNRQAIIAADAEYKRAADMFDAMYLPIKAADVTHESLIGATGVWERWRARVEASASGGAKSSVLNAFLGHFKKSTGVVEIPNQAGQGKVSAEFQFQYANRQINPVRIGHFIQMTFSAEGGAPLTGMAIQQAVTKIVERFNAGVKLPQDKLSRGEVLRQMQGLVLPQTDGAAVMVKLHKTPGVPGIDMQFDRVLHTKTSGPSVSATIPIVHQGGLTQVKPSAGYTDTVVGVVGERIGPDIHYQMLRHPQIAGLMDRAEAGGPAELRRLFDEFPRIKMAYFSRADTLLSTLQRAQDYAHAKAGGRLDPDRPLNAIDRLFNTGAFKRAAEVANHAKHHAPGSTANGDDPFEQAPTPLSDGFDALHMPDLAAARTRLDGLRTADERADFFCSPEGFPLLQAYRQVMDNICGIKNSVFFHTSKDRPYGFKAVIRDPKLRAAAEGEKKLKDKRRKALNGEPAGRRWFSTMSQREAGARGLGLSHLKILARNPTLGDKEAAAVRRELVRRGRMLGVSVDGLMGMESGPPPAKVQHNPASSTKAPAVRSSDSSPRQPARIHSLFTSGLWRSAFDSHGAAQAARVLRGLPLWGGEDGSDAESVQGDVVRSSRAPLNPSEQRRAQAALGSARDYINQESMPATRAWLAQRGIMVAHNNGGDNKVDCLIIALLQHAKRDYGDVEHAALAKECRDHLKTLHPGLGNQMLYPDDQAFVDLVAYVNQKFGRRMQVLIAMPGPDGHPVMLPTIPTGSPDDLVVLLQGAMHYEALTMAARK